MRLLKRIFGEKDDFPLSQKVFHIVCVILIFASLIGSVVNVALRVPNELTLITAFFVVFPILFLYLSYKLNRFKLAYNLFFVVGYLFIVVIWFHNAGVSGYMHLLLFSLIMWQMVFTESKDIFWLIFNLIVSSSLAIIHLLRPDLVVWNYDNLQAKVIDFIFTYLILAISTFFIIRALVQNYKVEKKRVDEVNLELVDVNKKLTESIRQLEFTDQTRFKLFSIISHDVRSFAGSIMNFSELLVDQLNDKEGTKEKLYARHVYDSSKNLNTVLFNLLSWTRIQMDVIKVLPENLNIKSLVEHELLLYDFEVRDKKQLVTVNIEESQKVFADSEMVGCIVRNLFSNAIKFTPAEGDIIISTELKEDVLEIRFADNGIGMNSETIDALINDREVFSRLGTNSEKGTGLGIKICKSFAEMNNGCLKIESTPGVGSTFILVLPVGQIS